MRVIPLGTSSGKPTLRRNVSALAVAREGEWLLFDCGEGTQMQVRGLCGSTSTTGATSDVAAYLVQ